MKPKHDQAGRPCLCAPEKSDHMSKGALTVCNACGASWDASSLAALHQEVVDTQARLRRLGVTYQAVGDMLGVTRARVQQLMAQHLELPVTRPGSTLTTLRRINEALDRLTPRGGDVIPPEAFLPRFHAAVERAYRQGWTAQHLAEATGYTKGTIYAVERLRPPRDPKDRARVLKAVEALAARKGPAPDREAGPTAEEHAAWCKDFKRRAAAANVYLRRIAELSGMPASNLSAALGDKQNDRRVAKHPLTRTRVQQRLEAALAAAQKKERARA